VFEEVLPSIRKYGEYKITKEVDRLKLTLKYTQEQHKLTKEELQTKNKVFRMLRKNHNEMVKKRTYYKFKLGKCFYIWHDPPLERFAPDSKFIKMKIGFSENINQRLREERTSVPNLILIYIVYLDDALFLEQMMLKKFRMRLTHSNHEIVKVSINVVKNTAKNLIKFFKYEHREEMELHLYNEPELDLMNDNIEIKEEEEIIPNLVFIEDNEDVKESNESNIVPLGVEEIDEKEENNEVIEIKKEIEEKINELEIVKGETKRCSKCKEVKCVECFAKNSKKGDGLNNNCKECEKLRYQESKNKKKKEVDMKPCGTCNIVKSCEEYYNRVGSSDGLSSQCKECILNRYNERVNEKKEGEYEEVKEKVCIDCKEEKKIEEYGTKTDSINGYNNRCKPCWSKYTNKDKKNKIKVNEKECRKCHKVKDVNKFWNMKRNSDEKNTQCIECCNK
jgi:hypothetical protein